MAVRVQREDFDLAAELKALTAGDHRIGGLASFVGLVRDMADLGAGAAPCCRSSGGLALYEGGPQSRRRGRRCPELHGS